MMNELSYQAEFERAAGIIRRSESLLVTGHIDPDGDCIGSMFALALYLRSLGKEAICYAPGDILDIYLTLPGAETLVTQEKIGELGYEAIFAVDSPTAARTENLANGEHDQPVVNIDHHPANQRYGSVNIVDERAASASMLVFSMLKTIDEPAITPDIASCLYLGILMDTGCFRFQNTDARAMHAAGELIEFGADAYQLTHDFVYLKQYKVLKLLAPVLESLEVHFDGRAATMEITREMLERTGGSFTDSEGFVDYAASIDDVELVALFREIEPEKIRISLRSKNEHDVSRLAETYGGGGHRKAAGLTMESDLAVARKIIIDSFGDMLNG